jgi:hypothetical protein
MSSFVRRGRRAVRVLACSSLFLAALVVPTAVSLGGTASASVAAPLTTFTMFSDSGDYIGGGVSREFDSTNGSISGSATASDISMQANGGTSGSSFNITIAPPAGQNFATGYYTKAQRTPFRSAGHPGVDISGDGRGCNTDAGSFEVRDLGLSGTTITRLDLLYEQHCEGGTAALFGELRINEPGTENLIVSSGAVTWPSTLPGSSETPVPIYVRNPGPAAATLGPTSVVGTNSADFHVQLDGCANQTITAGSSCVLYVGVTPAQAGPRTAVLQLSLPTGIVASQLDASGRTGTTSFDMTSDSGDWVGAGASYHFAAGVSASGSSAGVHGGVTAPDGQWWYFDFVPAVGTILAPGTYDPATRYPFNGTGNGLEVSGNGRGCNTILGSFTVNQVRYSPVDGTLVAIDLTFVQHCEGGVPALRGELKWNASPAYTAAPVSGLSVGPTATQATVSWVNPSDPNYADTVVRLYNDSPVGVAPIAGVFAYVGSGTTTTISNLTPGAKYTAAVFAVDKYGNVSVPTQQTFVVDSSFTGIVPQRLMDTRGDPTYHVGLQHQFGPNETEALAVAGGTSAVPSDASAVVINVTAVSPTAASYLDVWPAGAPQPNVSNVNFDVGRTVPSLATVGVGAAGQILLFNRNGHVDVIVDVVGYYRADPAASRFTPIVPHRIEDTRTDPSYHIGSQYRLGDHRDPRNLTVAGVGGVPASATTVVANVTVVGPDSASHLDIWPSGSARPNVSNLNYVSSQTVPNLVVVKVGAGGQISMVNENGSTDVIVDIVGYFTIDGGAAGYESLTPTRLIDTRSDLTYHVGTQTTFGDSNDPRTVVVTDGHVPADARALVATVTVVNPDSASDLEVWPAGAAKPNVSNLNYLPGQIVSNLVTVEIGTSGAINLRNQNGTVDVIIDVVGYYR